MLTAFGVLLFSGGMLGADIVTAEFDGVSNSATCALADRHVKSVAYPLNSSDGGDAVYPDEDTCGTSDWTLVNCSVDVANGTMTLELDRSLAPGNRQEDREISKTRNVILTAWGDGFGYHAANRQTVTVDMTRNGREAVGGQSLKESGLIPKDVTGSQALIMKGYAVPGNDTTYACAGFLVDVPADGKPRQIVAVEPIVDLKTDVAAMVHHFVLSSCIKVCFVSQSYPYVSFVLCPISDHSLTGTWLSFQ
jgi:hypothetical protein